MNPTTRLLAVAGLLSGCVLLAGCGSKYVVELRYDRPAKYMIPERIKRLAVAEFGGKNARDRQWGEVASDRLAAELDRFNRKYNRYELLERARLKAILDQHDLEAAIMDPAAAGKAGKLAKADAMIYGNVKVTARDERATRKTFDPLSRSMKTVRYTKRYCMAAVTFTMDDINTGKILATESLTREYDSETDKKSGAGGIGKALGFGGGTLPPTDQVISRLIEQCVAEFVSMISPHEVVVPEKLAKGKSELVETGNKLAVAREYTDALDYYVSAIEANPGDHGAVFNAGVMHEAMGQLKKAEGYYDRARKIEPKEQYIFARRRVRTEGGE